jgi:uncharacterized membrane protein
MTDLYERLFDPVEGEENVAVHYFRAALGDYATGNTTRTEIVNYWSLDTEAQTDLDVLLGEIDSSNALQKAVFLLELHDVLMITEAGAKYQTKDLFKARLGL